MESIAAKLKEKNIKPSYQRIKIFEYLVRRSNHPTVDQIFKELVREMPTLSKATVYNTVELFKKSGLAKVVTIGDNETRYDCNVNIHGHFKCESCGRIYDFPIDINALTSDVLADFKITEKDVYFKGICPRCRNKNSKQKGE
jgi:Fur family transcriptional regulator, peroxide stress response regulator